MKKRIMALTLAALMACSLAACGEKKEEPTASTSTAAVSSVSEAKEAEETKTEEVKTEETKAETAASDYAALDQFEFKCDIPLVEGDYKASDCVKLFDYKSLEIKDNYVEPSEDAVQARMVEMMEPEEVTDPDATIQMGDTVAFGFNGGTVQTTGTEGALKIGSGAFIQDLELGLIGLKKGEEADIDATFPEDYWGAEMAGQTITFKVKIDKISRAPELTDAWVAEKSGLGFSTVDEYREYVRGILEDEARSIADADIEYVIWQNVMDGTEIVSMPKKLLEDAAKNFDDSMLADAASKGVSLVEYLQVGNVDAEYYNNLKNEFAIQTASSTLVCYAIAEKENLTEESTEYKSVLKELCDSMGATEEDINQYYGEDVVKNYVLTYAVLDKLKEYVKIVK